MTDQTGTSDPQPPSPPLIDTSAWGKDVTRWVIPLIVSAVVATVARAGFNVSADTVTQYVAPLVALAYAAIARILEAKFPKQFGRALVFAKQAHILK